MKIYLIDKKDYLRMTFEEIKRVLLSGFQPYEWTEENITQCLQDKMKVK